MKFNFLTLKKTEKGYEYCERKGKDSVAFLLYNRNNGTVCIRNEYKPPLDTWVAGAFGGSLDKGISPVNTVIEEVAEEAGYVVKEEDVKIVGKCFVSSQMNQWCFLYAVDVTNSVRCPKTYGDNSELISDCHWVKPPNAMQCWKATIILNSLGKYFKC